MPPQVRKPALKKPAAAPASTTRSVKAPDYEVVGTSFVLSEFVDVLAGVLGVKPVRDKKFILATGCSGPSPQSCNIDCRRRHGLHNYMCAPEKNPQLDSAEARLGAAHLVLEKMVHGQLVEISASETNSDAAHALLRNCGSNPPLQLHHDIQDMVEGKSFDHITDCFTPVCTPREPVHLYFAGCPPNSGSSADDETAKSHAEALCSMIASFMPQCFIVENLVDSRFSEILRSRAVGEQYEWFALPMTCHPLQLHCISLPLASGLC